MIIVVSCIIYIKDIAELKWHSFPAFLFLHNLLYFLSNFIYLYFSKPYSGSVHILLHDCFLSAVLVGKEQMCPEGVIFICMYGWFFFKFTYKTVAKFWCFLALFWEVGLENTDERIWNWFSYSQETFESWVEGFCAERGSGYEFNLFW